jgi:phage shock protein C
MSQTQAKKVYRSQTDRKIAGVCGGLAGSFGADATIVRLLFLAALLMGGSAILVYIVMWVVVQEEPV